MSQFDGDGDEQEPLKNLIRLLPENAQGAVLNHHELQQLVEIVMDYGRKPLARFPSGDVELSSTSITLENLREAEQKVGSFGSDNRAGISGTLHRISCIRSRSGLIVGLTCRVGRDIPDSARPIEALLERKKSILILGPPGVGKTTVIRCMCKFLSEVERNRVVVVDTSNEIAGDGDIPHSSIGMARRMQVPPTSCQYEVMIEAVQNHTPEVIIIDEIGSSEECEAARTIARRGIQLIASAHGKTLQDVLQDPILQQLLGGVHSVILGDARAQRNRKNSKTIQERKWPPSFDVLVEMDSREEWKVIDDLEEAVDDALGRQLYSRTPYRSVLCKPNTLLESPVLSNPPWTGISTPPLHDGMDDQWDDDEAASSYAYNEKAVESSDQDQKSQSSEHGSQSAGEVTVSVTDSPLSPAVPTSFNTAATPQATLSYTGAVITNCTGRAFEASIQDANNSVPFSFQPTDSPRPINPETSPATTAEESKSTPVSQPKVEQEANVAQLDTHPEEVARILAAESEESVLQVEKNASREQIIQAFTQLMAKINKKNGKSADAIAARKKLQTSFEKLMRSRVAASSKATLQAALPSKPAQKSPVIQQDLTIQEVSKTSNIRAYLKIDNSMTLSQLSALKAQWKKKTAQWTGPSGKKAQQKVNKAFKKVEKERKKASLKAHPKEVARILAATSNKAILQVTQIVSMSNICSLLNQVPQGASKDVVNTQFQKVMLKVNSKKNKGDEAKAARKKLTAAYNNLRRILK